MKKLIFILAAAMALFSGCSDDDDNTLPGGNTETGSSTDPEPEEEYTGDPVPDEHYLGTLCAFNGDHRTYNYGDPSEYEANEYFNLPLFKSPYDKTDPKCEEEWWDNLVEELAYSGIDFVVANCRGRLPEHPRPLDHGDPTKLDALVKAMERRGVADRFKIAIFDDCPSSWDAARNYNLGIGYKNSDPKGVTTAPYPITDLDEIYKYIWDWNIKLAFQTIPEKYWFKFMDRPVIYFWSINNFLTGEHYGELRDIMVKIRADFKTTFGCEPYLIVDRAFLERDKSLYYRPYVDAVNDWFTMSNAHTIHEWYSGAKMGIGVPAFRKGTMFLDPRHGDLLIESLENTIGKGAHLTMIEGFTDMFENAALFRSTDPLYYDYPNQRLNIMRRYSKDPYPAELKVEAEGCDFYEDKSAGNSGTFYREGDLDIAQCDDQNYGWCVVDTEAGEWMEWKELPFRAQETVIRLRYRSANAAAVSFTVDETTLVDVQLPATGNEWRTVDAGKVAFAAKGLHTVRLNIVSGAPAINYFTLNNNHE